MRLCLRMPGKGPRVHLPKPTHSQRFCFSRSGWRPETGKLVVLSILANLTLCNRLSPISHQLFNSRGRFNCNHMGSFIFISENWIHLSSAFLLPADELCNFLNLTPCESNRTGHLWSYSRKFKTSLQLLHHLTLIPVEGFSSAFYKMNTTLSQFSCLKQNLLSYRLFTLVTACIQIFSQPVIIVIGRQSSSWKSSEGTETGSLRTQSL